MAPAGGRAAIGTCAAGLPPARATFWRRAMANCRARWPRWTPRRSDGVPSPTDFSMSIHHALLGVMSIQSRQPAGSHRPFGRVADSFLNGLLEAAVCIVENPDEPVILIYADQALPSDYGQVSRSRRRCAAAGRGICPGASRRRSRAADIEIEYAPIDAASPRRADGKPGRRRFLAFRPVWRNGSRRGR